MTNPPASSRNRAVAGRILLVEDSDRDAELTLHALATRDIAKEVLRLKDGVEAMDYLHRRGDFAGRGGGHPVVVLLDLKMPRIDGIEVLRQVKAHPALHTIPIVVMTSSREEQDLLRSYQLGANAYVVKPVNFDEFVGAVEQVGAFWAVLNETPPDAASQTGVKLN